MKRIICAGLAMILSGCVSSAAVNEKINNRFIGKNVDQFFVEHGAPAGRYQMNNGQILWTWDSGVSTINMPATTTVTGNTYGNTYGTGTSYGTTANYSAVTTGGGAISMQCVVQLLSDAGGTIIQAKILRDTIGPWTTSMCYETLKLE